MHVVERVKKNKKEQALLIFNAAHDMGTFNLQHARSLLGRSCIAEDAILMIARRQLQSAVHGNRIWQLAVCLDWGTGWQYEGYPTLPPG
jgi:hypothetical protein